MSRTHPCDITADRLSADYEREYEKFTPAELSYMGTIIAVLRDIASGERTKENKR
jgi:hypothetical protein